MKLDNYRADRYARGVIDIDGNKTSGFFASLVKGFHYFQGSHLNSVHKQVHAWRDFGKFQTKMSTLATPLAPPAEGGVHDNGNVGLKPYHIRARDALSEMFFGNARKEREFNGKIQSVKTGETTIIKHDGTSGRAATFSGAMSLMDMVGCTKRDNLSDKIRIAPADKKPSHFDGRVTGVVTVVFDPKALAPGTTYGGSWVVFDERGRRIKSSVPLATKAQHMTAQTIAGMANENAAAGGGVAPVPGSGTVTSVAAARHTDGTARFCDGGYLLFQAAKEHIYETHRWKDVTRFSSENKYRLTLTGVPDYRKTASGGDASPQQMAQALRNEHARYLSNNKQAAMSRIEASAQLSRMYPVHANVVRYVGGAFKAPDEPAGRSVPRMRWVRPPSGGVSVKDATIVAWGDRDGGRAGRGLPRGASKSSSSASCAAGGPVAGAVIHPHFRDFFAHRRQQLAGTRSSIGGNTGGKRGDALGGGGAGKRGDSGAKGRDGFAGGAKKNSRWLVPTLDNNVVGGGKKSSWFIPTLDSHGGGQKKIFSTTSTGLIGRTINHALRLADYHGTTVIRTINRGLQRFLSRRDGRGAAAARANRIILYPGGDGVHRRQRTPAQTAARTRTWRIQGGHLAATVAQRGADLGPGSGGVTLAGKRRVRARREETRAVRKQSLKKKVMRLADLRGSSAEGTTGGSCAGATLNRGSGTCTLTITSPLDPLPVSAKLGGTSSADIARCVVHPPRPPRVPMYAMLPVRGRNNYPRQPQAALVPVAAPGQHQQLAGQPGLGADPHIDIVIDGAQPPPPPVESGRDERAEYSHICMIPRATACSHPCSRSSLKKVWLKLLLCWLSNPVPSTRQSAAPRAVRCPLFFSSCPPRPAPPPLCLADALVSVASAQQQAPLCLVPFLNLNQ